MANKKREIIVVFCACVPLIAKQLKQVRKEGLCYGVKTSGFINFTFAESDADVVTPASDLETSTSRLRQSSFCRHTVHPDVWQANISYTDPVYFTVSPNLGYDTGACVTIIRP